MRSTKKKVAVLAPVVPLRPAAKRPRRAVRPPVPVATEEAEQALADMARQLTASPGPTQALRTHLQVVHTLLQPRACYVARYLAPREQLQVEHVRGRNDARITASAPGAGVAGRAYSTGSVQREEDTVAVPLHGPQGPNGVLVLLSPRRSASESLLKALASHLSAAYEVARLKDDGDRRNKDLQTAIAGLKSLEASRDELLGNVSHDLKNPLTTIKAYLAMLGREKLGPLTEQQRRAVQVCDRSADRMLRMVNDLLLMSRLQAGRMTLNQRPFGLKALAEEVVRQLQPLAERSQVQLTLLPCPEVFVRGDRERMAEALHHLVENGIHQCEPKDTVQVCVSTEESQAVLSVRDTGPGLSAEHMEHAFDPFYRPEGLRRDEGNLGLPLVAKILSLHGGRAEVSSTLGEGSTFQLVLPLFASAVSSPEYTHGPRAGGLLLVEDDADCREVLQQVLEQEGYTVTATSGAAEALALLGHMRPAMVLLDLRLSEEDGRSVLRHIRGTESLADTAVYIISGASEVSSLGAGQGLERIDGFFEKPLQLPRLLDTVAAVVRPNSRTPAGP